MTNTEKINGLWQEMRTAINIAYSEEGRKQTDFQDDFACLRDYAEDISWHDALAALLGRETANERQHRSNRPAVQGFSASTASKLILMNNVSKGASMPDMPRATGFLVLRQTAVEAEVIGWIVRRYLSQEWRDAVASFDYAKLMQGAA